MVLSQCSPAICSVHFFIKFFIEFLQVMHEEDGDAGLKVESPNGKKWTCYGDSKLFQPQEADYQKRSDTDKGKQVNLGQCRDALKQSIKEVHDAYVNKTVLQESQFGAWQSAPDLTKIAALNPGHNPLLFVKDNKLYIRLGGFGSTSSVCVDDRYSWTELALWTAFYVENAGYVVDKVKKLIGL